MSRWPVVSLRGYIDEVSVRKGDTPAEVLSVTNTDGFVRSLEVFDKQVFSQDARNYKLVRFDDLAYNPSRINVGSVARCDVLEGGAVSPMYIVVRCRESLSPQYLLHFLKSDTGRQHIAHRCVGAVRFMLRFRDLQEMEIPLPPFHEQERIVRILHESDELRRLRAQGDKRAARLAPTLFHAWFEAGTVDRAAWPSVTLESQCERITVGHVGPMVSEYVEHGVPFLRGQNIKRGRIDLTEVLYVSEEFHARLSKSALRPGDVVSVRTGKPGTTAVVPDSLPRANCADLIVMTPGGATDPEFLAELLNRQLGDQKNLRHSVGAAQQHFNIGEARRVQFELPPVSAQRAFAACVAEIRAVEAAQAASRQRLDDLFQSVLHSAFLGEL